MTQENPVQELNQIHGALLQMHRLLLQSQLQIHQEREQKELSLQDRIGLATSHPDFLWLKDFSNLILKIDDITLDKTKTPSLEDVENIKTELRSKIFQDEKSKELNSQISEIQSYQSGLQKELKTVIQLIS